jgi:ribosomal 30S subunit maturation factor RimM
MLLQKESQPTFVTINERDFWRKVAINESFCVVCFTLPDSKAKEIALLLNHLLHCSVFNTKAKRMGKVIRVTDKNVIYYSDKHGEPQEFML